MKTKSIIMALALTFTASFSFARSVPMYSYSSVAKFNQDSILEILNENPNDNVVYSGPSVYVALSMLAAGAEGSTQADLLKALNVKHLGELYALNASLNSLININTEDLKMLSQNALWIDNSFVVKQKYTQDLTQYFDAKVTVVPFSENPGAAAAEINDWAKNATNNLIPQIIDAGDAANLVALINNAVYFKASWAEEFDPKRTEKKSFTNASGSASDVDMMSKFYSNKVRYYQGGSALQVLELPYKKGAKMFIALPGNGIAGPLSVDNIAPSFFSQDFISEFEQNSQYVKANVNLPKMDIKTKAQLNQPLINMGLKDLFGRPDLKGISDDSVAVSYIKQDAALKVNEEGTEAAAITSIGIRTTSIDITPIIDFNVDRSFLFMIVEENTSMVLFQGAIKSL